MKVQIKRWMVRSAVFGFEMACTKPGQSLWAGRLVRTGLEPYVTGRDDAETGL